MSYAYVDIWLVNLDLTMRRVSFNLSGSFGFAFNTSEQITIDVWTVGVHAGYAKLVNDGYNENVTHFHVSNSTTSFSGFFTGGPEMYPFDHYIFNFTLEFHFIDVFISENTKVNSECISSWPMAAQFDGPLDVSNHTLQGSNGPVVSILCRLDRPMWLGYASLLPVCLMFALIGFIPLLRTRKETTFRLSVCLAVLTSAMAYSFSIQNTLPPGRYYLSIPEALIYVVIGSLTIFVIFTVAAHRFVASSVGQVIMDASAALFSTALLGFLFLTFYTTGRVAVFWQTYNSIVGVELSIVALLFSGLLLIILRKAFSLKKSKNLLEYEGNLNPSSLDTLNKGLYIDGYALSFYAIVVIWYIGWSSQSSSLVSDVLLMVSQTCVFIFLGITPYILRRIFLWRRKKSSISPHFSDTVGSFILGWGLGDLMVVLWPGLIISVILFYKLLLWLLLALLFWLLRSSKYVEAQHGEFKYVV